MYIKINSFNDNFIFVSDSQDVAEIKKYLPTNKKLLDSYDSFFVRIEDGEYIEIWGVAGIVPYLDKLACRLL